MQQPAPYVDREAERSGVIVNGYALTWSPTPVVSKNGTPYFQQFSRDAFDEQLEFCHITQSYRGIACLFGHGTDEDGRPVDVFSRSLGEIVEIIADDTGLLTRVAYVDSVLADEVLRMLAQGEVTAQSMRATIYEPADPDAEATEYGLVTIRRARLKEFGPNLDPHDPGAKVLDIAGIKPRRRATWVDEVDTLVGKAEALDERARAITKEIDAVAAWERQARRQPIRRREPAPRLSVTNGMTSGARWAARGEAEREAERLGGQARQLLAEHGHARSA